MSALTMWQGLEERYKTIDGLTVDHARQSKRRSGLAGALYGV
jgi:hypothetical protein